MLDKIAATNNLLTPLEDQLDVADGGGEGGGSHLPHQPLHVVTHLWLKVWVELEEFSFKN